MIQAERYYHTGSTIGQFAVSFPNRRGLGQQAESSGNSANCTIVSTVG
jgi:hypothetical protein